MDLSLDYSKNKFESKDQNRPTSLEDCRNNTEVNLLNNKYNKKIVGNFPKSHMKNYPNIMLSYQEFDEPIKNEKQEKKEKNFFDNNNNNEKKKIKEDVVIQSIKLLLTTLNTSELKCVNEDIQNMLKEKKV